MTKNGIYIIVIRSFEGLIMLEIRRELFEVYQNGFYDYFCTLFKQYLNKARALDYAILECYVDVLIKKNQYDEAYNLIRLMEKSLDKYPELGPALFQFYYNCHRSEDAERIYKRRTFYLSKPAVVRMYLKQGKIREAKDVLNTALKHKKDRAELLFLNRKIMLHEKCNAFIETEYNSFVKNGNQLEVGHIVCLKKEPTSVYDISGDEKRVNRPYMIWKREGNKLYLFPVTTVIRPRDYILYKANYPNADRERAIKDIVCFSSVENVLTVSDKVRDEDLKIIIDKAYKQLYFCKDKQLKVSADSFLQQYHDEAQLNDVIVYVDAVTKENKYYYIVNIKDNCYDVVELDSDLNVVSNNIQQFRKERLYLYSFTPSEEKKAKIEEQIPRHTLSRTLYGAIIDTIQDKYIVLYQKGDFCICISYLNSPSWFKVITIKKEEILNTYGFVSGEKLQELRDMVDRSCTVNVDNLLRKCK